MHAPRLRANVQPALWATPGADTWRGPSDDTLELLNPEGFSFKALGRKPEAREHRKRTIGASRFRRAIRPVPVLLFGVTTLRIIFGHENEGQSSKAYGLYDHLSLSLIHISEPTRPY